MKKLIVSIKSSHESLKDFKRALSQARKGRLKEDHFEISFDNKKDFHKFLKNIEVLSAIVTHKPKSIYDLAKILGTDVSNLNKIILFFEEIGAIKIQTAVVSGRNVKVPVVEYDNIEFDLWAA